MTQVRIPIGQGSRPSYIAGRYASRHGLITGATGTGKTYTLATLAEGFSRAGVPVFMVDAKGDLAGMSRGPCPVSLIKPGREARVAVQALGPDLLARALNLTEAQAGAIDLAYALAEHERRPFSTLADLQDVLRYMASHAKPLSRRYGLISPASVSVVQRALVALERDGAAEILRGPSFDVASLLDCREAGGLVTILDGERLARTPTLYAAFLIYVLSDLYERLPEVGDLERPRLALILDEAHLLFADAPAGLLQRVERIVRLIRSKGVGVYFASQSPADIPSPILAQLGNRVQHAMRAATTQDQRAARVAAETMPLNPKVDAYAAILAMGVGSALVSTISEDGTPRPCDVVKVQAPASTLGAIPAALQVDSWSVRPRQVAAAATTRATGLVRLAAVMFGSVGAAVCGLTMIAAHH